ncbi:MAG: hypothetical protein QG635_46 [Bacteroidota bacterium]|nr:hypothetical protein [Bacteroidota bacterium]
MKYLPMILLIFILALSSCSNIQVSKSQWTQKTIIADGKSNDWGDKFNFYDEDSKILCSIANDSSHLYLLFKTDNSITQMKILRAGMLVTFQTDVKNSREAAISFPAIKVKEDGEKRPGFMPQRDIESMKEIFLQIPHNMETNGFISQNGFMPNNNKDGIRVSIGWSKENSMCFEIAVPLSELFVKPYQKEDLTSEITLKVDIKAPEKPDFSKREFSGRQQPPTGAEGLEPPSGGRVGRGGVGGVGSGGRHPGGGYAQKGRGSGGWEELFNENSFKHKFTMAGQ